MTAVADFSTFALEPFHIDEYGIWFPETADHLVDRCCADFNYTMRSSSLIGLAVQSGVEPQSSGASCDRFEQHLDIRVGVEGRVLAGNPHIVLVCFDWDHTSSRADLLGHHHRNDTMMGAKVEDNGAGCDASAEHDLDFGKLIPVVVVLLLGNRIFQSDVDSVAGIGAA